MDLVQRFEQYINKNKATLKNKNTTVSSFGEEVLEIWEKGRIAREMAYILQSLRDAGEDDVILDEAYKTAFEFLLANFTIYNWELFKTVTSNMHQFADLYNAFHYDLDRSLTKVCSLSEVNNSVLMWSHYADSHHGFCIEYDFRRLPSNSDLLKNLYPVFYHDVAEGEAEDRLKGIKFYRLYSLLRKSSAWKYEKEWRFVYSHNAIAENILRLPILSAVYLGCSIKIKDQEQVLTIAKEKRIKVFMSQKKGRTLSFVQLPLE